MDAVLKKLNFKDHPEILVLNAPSDLQGMLDAWQDSAEVKTKAGKSKIAFAVVFCMSKKEVDSAAEKITSLADGDAILWFCYPKGTSKRYKCDFNRDNGWAKLGALGWEPVRQVAIDDDWSALRFRKPDFIKTMNRSFAMTEKGKVKVAAAKKK